MDKLSLLRLPLATIELESPEQRGISDVVLAGLQDSLSRLGLLQPPRLRPIEGGRYAVISGYRRLWAAKLSGWDAVDALVTPLTPAAAALQFVAENQSHRSLNPFEQLLLYEAADAATRQEIGRTLPHFRPGASNRVLPRLLRCREIAAPLRPLLVEKAVPLEQLALLAKFAPALQHALAAFLERGAATAQECRRVIEEVTLMVERCAGQEALLPPLLAEASSPASLSQRLAEHLGAASPGAYRQEQCLCRLNGELARGRLQRQSGSEFAFALNARIGSGEDLQRLAGDVARLQADGELQAIFRGGR